MILLLGHREIGIERVPGLDGGPAVGVALFDDGSVEGLLPLLVLL